jgi:hypothetical protein
VHDDSIKKFSSPIIASEQHYIQSYHTMPY